MLVWSLFEEPEIRDTGKILRRPGAWGLVGWTTGDKAYHSRQRDALVPLRVGRLLQDFAAELEDTEVDGAPQGL